MIRVAVLIAVLVAMLQLASCAPRSGTLAAEATGVSGRFSRQIPISDDPHHVLMGHLIDVTRDGEHARALVIHQRWEGVHRLSFREAWSDGVRLPFRSTSRRSDGCTHGNCRDNSIGFLFLSDALFTHAADHGLTARLVGPSDSVDISVPASLFALTGS